MKSWYPVKPRNPGVRQHQRENQHEPTTNRVVRARDCRLQRIGDQQDEDKVVQRELADLSLPEYAERN
jgi:hypothetical protein